MVRQGAHVELRRFGEFHFAVHAASPELDRVSLSESTTTWRTVKYATNAENGFVSGSLDKKIIVDRAFRIYVLENRYLKVTLLPEFGGRILSIIYRPTGHEQPKTLFHS